MPKYIIEREIPNAAALSVADLKSISQRSCAALRGRQVSVGLFCRASGVESCQAI